MIELKLTGKTALVTGASRGIGRAIASTLAAAGAQVAALARSEGDLENLAARIERDGGRCLPLRCDVGLPEEVESAVGRTRRELGHIDLLVNNAGAFAHRPFDETIDDDYRTLLNVNVIGPARFCRLITPAMVERKAGKVINIASTSGRKGYKCQAAYCASKHGIVGMSKALALELHGTGVTVHVISPGGVNTDLVRSTRSDVNVDEYMDPQEVADVVLFVAAMEGQATIDEIVIRRRLSTPWAY